jgi:hypothetical protein
LQDLEKGWAGTPRNDVYLRGDKGTGMLSHLGYFGETVEPSPRFPRGIDGRGIDPIIIIERE